MTSLEPIQGLGDKVLVQICIIVDDADKYAKRYSELLGIPIPEVHVTDGHSETEAEYYGEATEAKARIYHWHFGNVGFELLQPLGPKSVWQDWLDEHGPSVHHVAFRVTDSDGVAREFARHSFPVTPEGLLHRPPPERRAHRHVHLPRHRRLARHRLRAPRITSIRMGRSADEHARPEPGDALPGRLRRPRRRGDREEVRRGLRLPGADDHRDPRLRQGEDHRRGPALRGDRAGSPSSRPASSSSS